jgi:hypothetical protein
MTDATIQNPSDRQCLQVRGINFADRDCRSVQAGLRGRDDGRVACYERAFKAWHIAGQEMSRDVLWAMDDAVIRYLAYEQCRSRRLTQALLGCREGLWWVFCVVVLAGIAGVVMEGLFALQHHG